MTRFVLAGRLLALPLALTLTACSDSLLLPSGIPGLPLPTPKPTVATIPAPTPTPAPTATPAPNPTPPGSAPSCTLPPMPDCGGNGCCSEGGTALFNDAIGKAQDELARTRPDIVSGNGDVRVGEVEYTDALATMLMRQNPGMCAVGGGRGSRSKDEVGIKVDNGMSQNVDVIIGGSHRHWVGGRYTCRPAAF
jgi:hypothetical protein